MSTQVVEYFFLFIVKFYTQEITFKCRVWFPQISNVTKFYFYE